MHKKNKIGVIAVDLDGTLVFTDTLHELVLCLVRNNPIYVLILPIWLLQGKAVLKAKLAKRVKIDVTTLPYNSTLIDWLNKERTAGKYIVLCTASDKSVAQDVADHLGLFDEVLASDGATNNAGINKRVALDAKFGVKGYDYAGNSGVDIAVWAAASKAIVVNASAAITKKASQVAAVSKVFHPRALKFSHWGKVFRVHQWLKNLLIFVPLLADHQFYNTQALLTIILAFVSFSLCASAVYIANDLLDLENDRKHPRKRYRPFASASVPIKSGVILALLLVVVSLAIGIVVGTEFTTYLVVYFLITCAYSLWIKRLVLIDCITLAGLYTLRIIAGAAAVAIAPSFWLMAFSLFIFLSLAFVKRYTELQMQARAGNSNTEGRGYKVSDLPFVQSLGVNAGFAAVLVLALYINSGIDIQLYTRIKLIWYAVPIVMYWISWVWFKAHRGEMHDDPIIFASQDRTSQITAIGLLLIFCYAI